MVGENFPKEVLVVDAQGGGGSHQSLTQETLKVSRVVACAVLEKEAMTISPTGTTDTWITPYQCYVIDGLLPSEPTEAKAVKRNSGKYTVIDGKLFRHGYAHLALICISWNQCTRVVTELHEGICESHIGGRALALKVIRAGYYWPTMKEDCGKYAKQCEQCQKQADWHHAPVEELRSIYSPWPFHTWGIDILGHFPLVIRQMKYLVVAIEYFTKWIEAEPVAQISAHKVQHFVWKCIVCCFGVPRHLMSDNGTQFASQQLGKLCSELKIK